ncbi:Ras family protein, partial [Opisthorchis viverrini]
MSEVPDYDQDEFENKVKIICLGDSAVGKSNHPQQLSTYAVTLYKHTAEVDNRKISVDFWDTAGQERFQSMHASYYYQAHACIFVFDVTRKITYKNLPKWYEELRQYRPDIPCLCIANKIDGNPLMRALIFLPLLADMTMTNKTFNFAKKNKMALYFVSASNGTNVVRAFRDAIRAAVAYKESATDIMDQIMEELE